MNLVLGWLIDKVWSWRSLPLVPRYALIGMIYALGLGLAYVSWKGHLAQQDLWYEMLIRDAVH